MPKESRRKKKVVNEGNIDALILLAIRGGGILLDWIKKRMNRKAKHGSETIREDTQDNS